MKTLEEQNEISDILLEEKSIDHSRFCDIKKYIAKRIKKVFSHTYVCVKVQSIPKAKRELKSLYHKVFKPQKLTYERLLSDKEKRLIFVDYISVVEGI